MPVLLAVPNISEGGDRDRLETLERAFTRGVSMLDRHTDGDHDRTVFTLAGRPGPLMEALVAGAEEALETIDMSGYGGVHPAIGALDVCPLVWLDPAARDAARTEAVATGPSAPTSATAAWPSSGCGWSRESCNRTSDRVCRTPMPVPPW
jgi:glutamate formiminotransferase